MKTAVWRDRIDSGQLHFGEISIDEEDEPTFLFSLFCCQAEAIFGLSPEALSFVDKTPVPIELTLFVK